MGELKKNNFPAVYGVTSITEMFLKSLDVKPKTKECYGKALKNFFGWLAHAGRKGSTREDILAYKGYLMENYKAATVSSYITALRSFYGYLEAMGVCPNITTGIKGARGSKGHNKDILTKEQAKALLSGMDQDTAKGKRDFALMNLLLRTGLRTVEAERANFEDIRQDSEQTLLYVHGKGRDNKDEFIILTPSTLNPLLEYIRATGGRKPHQPIFLNHSNRGHGNRLTTRSIRRIVKENLKAAGLESERLTAHSLRHTAITFALLSGASLQEVQQLARHSNINTTLIYAHNIQRLRNAAERKIDDYLDT